MEEPEKDPWANNLTEEDKKNLLEKYQRDPYAYFAEVLQPVAEGQKGVLKNIGPKDWEELRQRVLASGGIKHATMVAHMPRHEPIRPMSGVTLGIYPIPMSETELDGVVNRFLDASQPRALYYQHSKRKGEKASDQSQTDSPSSSGDPGASQEDPPQD